ncbi:RDD family protein [Texcoconibacillus texcoconensis]|uniref:Putative RDD family membrane protein YckC n=1 Tax=Texcoconibacillus texcoconensis TaxID=1095777 RepID=A0A840QMY5_9BACI|nr:RDD family protein [Texcoconibacillus texcoconensis]MBB5172752.1 putative RDD family membrane protein YckC [Texcoconibacillus texcoconensis]
MTEDKQNNERNEEIAFDEDEDLSVTDSVEKRDESSNTVEMYAGFWIRFWAYLVDIIVVSSINGILVTPFFRFTDLMDQMVAQISVLSVTTTLVGFIYFVVLTKWLGRTIGKQLFGLVVVRYDNAPLRWNDVVFREVVGRFIHQAFFFLYALYFVVAFHSKKRGLHDLIADTQVICIRERKV